jgi:hypothetical protein
MTKIFADRVSRQRALTVGELLQSPGPNASKLEESASRYGQKTKAASKRHWLVKIYFYICPPAPMGNPFTPTRAGDGLRMAPSLRNG